MVTPVENNMDKFGHLILNYILYMSSPSSSTIVMVLGGPGITSGSVLLRVTVNSSGSSTLLVVLDWDSYTGLVDTLTECQFQ